MTMLYETLTVTRTRLYQFPSPTYLFPLHWSVVTLPVARLVTQRHSIMQARPPARPASATKMQHPTNQESSCFLPRTDAKIIFRNHFQCIYLWMLAGKNSNSILTGRSFFLMRTKMIFVDSFDTIKRLIFYSR